MRPLLPWLLCFASCAGQDPSPAVVYATALAEIDAHPEQAATTCATLPSGVLRADCITAAAERLAGGDPAAAAALCGGLEAGVGRDECHFQVAEQSTDPRWCAQAGRFEGDCAMHLWTQTLQQQLPHGLGPGEVEALVEPLLATHGFAPEDGRPWIALYRMVHGSRRPVDRPGCARAPRPVLVKLCQDAALDLYGDLLNHARDTGTFPCDGGPLPALLAAVPDPELEALVARRRTEDLCPG